MKKFYISRSKRDGTLVRIFGLYLGYNVWGNTFSPALCVSTDKPKTSVLKTGVVLHRARVTLTFRSSYSLETKIYWRGGFRFDWHSTHVARRLGKAFEAPHGTCWHYEGWLGTHWDF